MCECLEENDFHGWCDYCDAELERLTAVGNVPDYGFWGFCSWACWREHWRERHGPASATLTITDGYVDPRTGAIYVSMYDGAAG